MFWRLVETSRNSGMHRHGFVAQGLRYGLAGGTAVATHLAVLWMLAEFAGVAKTLASAIGFCCAVPVNYLLQHRFVFDRQGGHGTYFLRYVSITFFFLGVNVALYALALRVIGVHYIVAQIVVIGIVFLANFLTNRRYTFGAPVCREKAASPEHAKTP